MMLAQRGGVEDIVRLEARGFLFDLKIDGERCRADIHRGGVGLTSRRSEDMTHRYPEVVAALSAAFPDTSVVLDGEIAVNDDRGLPSWPLSHKRDAQQSGFNRWAERLPATFYAFDVLEAQNTDIRRRSFTERRKVLDALGEQWDSPHLKVVLHTEDGVALWTLVNEYELEGMIAKRPASTYRTGRTSDWIKIKRTSTVTCLVGGTEAGTGSRASTFGALKLYLLNPGEEGADLVPVGKVGSGFSDLELKRVMRALHQPPVIVEVEYLDVSPDGQLRQPVFQRLRTDLDPTDCTIDQLA